MDKFDVHISFVWTANNRRDAWSGVREFCDKKLRDLASVDSISMALPEPEDWIAINEPIANQKVVV